MRYQPMTIAQQVGCVISLLMTSQPAESYYRGSNDVSSKLDESKYWKSSFACGWTIVEEHPPLLFGVFLSTL